MTTELEQRKAICEVGRRMYEKNLVAATDGNISVRLGPNRYLCTPSGISKGFMSPNDIVVADAEGNKVYGEGKVTSEFYTHLAAYEERDDMNAVVHAHPPKAIGFTLAGRSLADCVLPELVMSLGGIPTTDYATPASKEGGQVIREMIRKCDALMIDKHGALTLGVDVMDAYYRLEKLEHAAETLLTAHILGGPSTLGREEVEKLYEARASYGVSGKAYTCAVECGGACQDCDTCVKPDTPELDSIVSETLRQLGQI